jgi:hypothetical protein
MSHDPLSISLSIIALLLAGLSLLDNRRRTRLEKTKYIDSQVEKAHRRFEVRINEVIKKEIPDSEPCSIWAVKFVVTNRSDEQAFLEDLVVELGFRRLRPSTKQILLELLSRSEEPVFAMSYSFVTMRLGYSSSGPSWPETSPSWDDFFHTSTRLVNWETEKPIYLTEFDWHRGPGPGEKEVWMLFGKLPTDLGAQLLELGLYLSTIKCYFHTDQGTIPLSESYFEFQTAPDAYIAKFNQLAASSVTKPMPAPQ